MDDGKKGLNPPLTADRTAALTANGHLDLTNAHWFIGLTAKERTRVYTLRAAAARRACNAELQRLKKDST
jgi:hypothetical protein